MNSRRRQLAEHGPTHLGHGVAEPIGLEYVCAALQTAGFAAQWLGEQGLVIEQSERGRSLVLLSAMTWDFADVFDTARLWKGRGAVTTLGGYHACGYDGRIDTDAFDYVILGEGERAIVELVHSLCGESSSDLERPIAGKGPVVIRGQRLENLDELAWPTRSRRWMKRYKLHDLMWPAPSRQECPALVLASRGCAHSCDFCASATVWGSGVRLRSPANVVAELKDLKQRFDTNMIVFIDQSLGQAKRWTIDLCKMIEEARLGMSWYHQCNLTISREVVRAMASAGCTKIGFGLEGMSPRSVERFKPQNPHDFDFVNDLFDYCRSLGLFVKAYLMLGSPWETERDIAEYREHIGRIRASEIKISYFTPFPGTRAWEQYSDQLVTRDWSQFDTVSMPVVHNPRISVEQYHAIRAGLFQTFYGSQTYFDVTAQMLRRFPHYVQSYREFVDYLRAFDMIKGDESWLDLLGLNRESVCLAPGEVAVETAQCK